MSDLLLIDNIADAITRLRYLEKQDAANKQMIALLARQKDDLALELSDAQHNFGVEMHQMREERDTAIKKSDEVKSLIDKIGMIALEGTRKMKGDDLERPPSMAAAPIVKHLSQADKRLPPMTPEMDDRLEKPQFLTRPARGDEVRRG